MRIQFIQRRQQSQAFPRLHNCSHSVGGCTYFLPQIAGLWNGPNAIGYLSAATHCGLWALFIRLGRPCHNATSSGLGSCRGHSRDLCDPLCGASVPGSYAAPVVP